MEIKKSCTNCVFEYTCKWCKDMLCDDWKPDNDIKKLLEKYNLIN
jgi:hypothetical protein